MENLEKQLIEVLSREVRVYEDILAIKSEEKEALLEFATPYLEKCTQAQDLLTKEATELEYRRRSIVAKMADERGLERGEHILREVLEWLTPHGARECGKLGDKLRDLFAEIAHAQDANADLIGGATRFVKRFIDALLAKSKEDPIAYARGGAKARLRETMPGILDRRA